MEDFRCRGVLESQRKRKPAGHRTPADDVSEEDLKSLKARSETGLLVEFSLQNEMP